MLLAEPGPVQVRIQRGVGSKAMRKCPDPTAGPPFSGPFRTVVKRNPTAAGAVAASVVQRLTLRPRLRPALYRITVRAVLPDGTRSSPARVFLRVLER